jgi:hypothetical protein
MSPHDLADAKALALQGGQVDPGDDEVAAHHRRRNLPHSGQRRDDRQVLGLQQGDTAVAATTAIVIAFESATGEGTRGADAEDRRTL